MSTTGLTAKKRRPKGKVSKQKSKVEANLSANINALSKHGLRNVHMIDYGGNFMTSLEEFWNDWTPRLEHVPHRIARLVGNKKNNAYVYVQHEIDGSDLTANTPVPVIIAVICPNMPTLSTVKNDTQNQIQFMESFAANGLTWEQLNSSNIHVLKSTSVISDGFNIMNLRKPTDVLNESPKSITIVEVQYSKNNRTYQWQVDIDTLEEFLQEEMEEDNIKSAEDKEAIKKLLIDKKKSMKQDALAKVQRMQATYGDMKTIAQLAGTDESQVKQNLESMKVYKIFPTGLKKPTPTPFGDSGGFRYQLQVNGHCQAHQFFVQ